MKVLLSIMALIAMVSPLFAVNVSDEQLKPIHLDSVIINKNQPIAPGELICSITRESGVGRNSEPMVVITGKNFSYSYNGIEDGKIIISRDGLPEPYRYIKLPIDKKRQAILNLFTNQKLLITVDSKNHIIVENLGS